MPDQDFDRRIHDARDEIEANRLALQRDFARAGWLLLGVSMAVFAAGVTLLIVWP